MKVELTCLIEAFPSLEQKIVGLYESNKEFQVLCYDYFLSTRLLKQWKASKEKAETFTEEYTELSKALEARLLEFIR